MARGWNYLAYRLNGDGTETLLSNDVPLSQPKIEHVLSGAGGVSGRISPEVSRLQTSKGDPIFDPWSTAIYAQKDGRIRGGGILVPLRSRGPELSLQAQAFTSYADGMPYFGELSRVNVDPMDMFREIWRHLQSFRGGNLGITLDTVKSPVRVGRKEERVEFKTDNGEDVSFEAGPHKLNYWDTTDLGAEAVRLAAETPFDFYETHAWSGEQVAHRIRLGYPRLGRRRKDLSFVVGVNIFTPPPVDWEGDDYASEVVVLGAGQGRKMIRGTASRQTTRLRRVAVVQRKDLRTKASANLAAASEVAARLGDADISEVVVSDHPNAPLGSYELGDEILVQTRRGWSQELRLWVRILAMTIDPLTDETVLQVARVEKVA